MRAQRAAVAAVEGCYGSEAHRGSPPVERVRRGDANWPPLPDVGVGRELRRGGGVWLAAGRRDGWRPAGGGDPARAQPRGRRPCALLLRAARPRRRRPYLARAAAADPLRQTRGTPERRLLYPRRAERRRGR